MFTFDVNCLIENRSFELFRLENQTLGNIAIVEAPEHTGNGYCFFGSFLLCAIELSCVLTFLRVLESEPRVSYMLNMRSMPEM